MNTSLDWTTLDTPFGPCSAAVDASGAVAAIAFGHAEALRARLPRGTLNPRADQNPAAVREVRRQLAEYFAGRRREFSLQLAPAGSGYQQRVRSALQRIPAGETRSYGELARQLQSSARAVGRANATNPVAVVVPCHRVIGADGALTGYAWGVEKKRRLLAHEQPAKR